MIVDHHNPPHPDVDRDGLIPIFRRVVGSWEVSVRRRPFAARDLAGHYDQRAATWTRTVRSFGFDVGYRDLVDAALDLPREGGDHLTALDVGIGGGCLSSALCGAAGVPVRLSGVDVSPAMISRASARLAAEGVAVDARQGDVRALPYKDASFDVVMAAHVLEHLPDPAAGLSEMARVLRPGGTMILSVTRPSKEGAIIQLLWRVHRASHSEVEDWISAAGLRETRRVDYPVGTRARRMSIGYVARKPLVLPMA
ncbi:MAG: class I SAM-dependent methyltransferase [Pseudomonadota bacterium]